jgi:hypothetical protein
LEEVFSDESDDDESNESGQDIMEEEKVGEAEVEGGLENGETVGVVLLFLFLDVLQLICLFFFCLFCFASFIFVCVKEVVVEKGDDSVQNEEPVSNDKCGETKVGGLKECLGQVAVVGSGEMEEEMSEIGEKVVEVVEKSSETTQEAVVKEVEKVCVCEFHVFVSMLYVNTDHCRKLGRYMAMQMLIAGVLWVMLV